MAMSCYLGLLSCQGSSVHQRCLSVLWGLAMGLASLSPSAGFWESGPGFNQAGADPGPLSAAPVSG